MYLSIEGVIGVGKTTLARLLQPAFGAALLLEVFEENPFLSDFYADRVRYAFQTQIFFLLSRYHQQRRVVMDVLLEERHLIADYTFEKDALFAGINLQGDELEMYYKVHEALAEKIRLPDLVVYLRADTNTLMQRIAFRDRSYERNMERDYIEQLNQAYDEFFNDHQHRRSPVLTIDTGDLDYVRNPEHLKWTENRIRQALKLAPFQPELPMETPHGNGSA
jgi:deoxyguanosine kinase